MVNRGLLFLVFFLLLASSGCLKPKTTADCDAIKAQSFADELKAGEVVTCYHEVAVWYALKRDNDSAISSCEKIGNKNAFYLSEMNNCFADIADVLNDARICERINTSFLESAFSMSLVSGSYKDQCKEKAKPEATVKICGSILFIILPLFSFVFLLYKNPKNH